MIEIYELEYVSKTLHRNSKGRDKEVLESGIDRGDGDGVVLMDPFLLAGVRICTCSFTSEGMLLVELTEALFENEEQATDSQTGVTK